MENGKQVEKTHLWKKGQSGNPAGRPKGTRNQITIMKLALEGDLRTALKKDAQEILQKAIQLAKSGDQAMIKLLVDKMIPTSKSVDDEPAKERVQVFIGELPNNQRPVIDGRVINEAEVN